jgi:hypothetical protein
MQNNTKVVIVLVLIVVLSFVASLYYSANKRALQITETGSDTSLNTQVTYSNTTYGFNFLLPVSWLGYSVIEETWKGTALVGTSTYSGPKLLIRNPKWTTAVPHEDLPVLIFTIVDWEEYTTERFSVGAAPIKATELARNNRYVFALPARWDFDYSQDFKEAQGIMAGNPIRVFDK